MDVFVTGATGFLTGAVARGLLARGDRVRALVRDPSRARGLDGAELVRGDLADAAALEHGMRGADAVVHGAAIYAVGIPRSRRPQMFETNVVGAERVLSLAAETGVRRIVHVSTIAVFGNTHGRVVDETHERSGPFTSYYEETKYRAHEIAKRLAARGAPIVIAQPGQTYGPGDHSGFGGVLASFARGRLPLLPFPDLGLSLVHVEDVSAGIILALVRGAIGANYPLGGDIVRMRAAFATLARVLGRRPPLFDAPYAPLRLAALVRPDVREIVSSSRGVTFWASDARARRELGYAPRDLATGFRDTFAAGGAYGSSSSSSSSSDSNSSE